MILGHDLQTLEFLKTAAYQTVLSFHKAIEMDNAE